MEENTTTAATLETLEAILAKLREITAADVSALGEDKKVLDKIAATAARLHLGM